MHVLKQLNLSAEQQTQIKSILAASKPQFQSLGAGMRSNAEAMAAMSPTDPGYPALLATAKANAAARIQQMSDVKAQIFAVLTQAQQEQIPQIIAADKAQVAAAASELGAGGHNCHARHSIVMIAPPARPPFTAQGCSRAAGGPVYSTTTAVP